MNRQGPGSVNGGRIGWLAVLAIALLLGFNASEAHAAGLLKPVDGSSSKISIKSHRVDVTINNGFARTEVDQVFVNGDDRDLEAIYTFPLPKQLSLSEVSLWIDGQEAIGEVVEKKKAKTIYEDQKAQGNDTALAEKDDFKAFNVHVGNVRAGMETRVRLVYYQPVEIDLNVGRYLYPLAEGNVDEERIAFWTVDDKVEEELTFNLTLKSAFPVKDVRLPGYDNQAAVKKETSAGEEPSSGEIYRVTLESRQGANLSRDIVFYYRLDDSVPARVEVIPYRESPDEPGTFMMVVTPGASLQRIAEGVDWTFVLDSSGSMSGGKIATLADGVARVLGKFSPRDRFRIITFNDRANDFSGGFVQATPENVQTFINRVRQIHANGGTALFAGLEMAYSGMDADRTTGIILVTDGVCNEGPTHHADFIKLMKQHDVRLFTFVIGNGANQPLLDRLANDSGGFAMNISEADDIAGRLIQAKAKLVHEALHGLKLNFHGEKVTQVTPATPGTLYMGQQLVLFGRYPRAGDMEVELSAKISGQEHTWRCKAILPELDLDNPEIERLWALSSIEEIMKKIRESGETEDLRKSWSIWQQSIPW
jgi:Ca-activated chloride channel homolog